MKYIWMQDHYTEDEFLGSSLHKTKAAAQTTTVLSRDLGIRTDNLEKYPPSEFNSQIIQELNNKSQILVPAEDEIDFLPLSGI